MGQARQRKLAGTYPAIDSRQTMKEAARNRTWDPHCPKCHGTGIIGHHVVEGETRALACSCEFKRISPAYRVEIDKQRQIEDIRGTLQMAVAKSIHEREAKA